MRMLQGLGFANGRGDSLTAAKTAGFAALLLLAIAIGAAATQTLIGLRYSSTTDADIAAQIDAFALSHPGAGAMFTALEENYPEVYESLTRRAASALRRRDFAAAEAAASEAMRSLFSAKAAYVSLASPERLETWAKSAIGVMNAAKSGSPEFCARIAFGGAELAHARPSPVLANALGRHAAASIAAYREGESAPRRYDAPSSADQAALARSVSSAGLASDETERLADPGSIRRLSGDAQCALGIKLMRGVMATPEPVRSRILSAMAARSAARP